MSPRAAITKHLLDGDDSFLTGSFDTPADSVVPPAAAQRSASTPAEPDPNRPTPFDADAT